MTDQTAAIEVWARMLCAADVHVHGDDHPTWQQLVGETGSQIRGDYRKAAAWLLPRLTVAVSSAGPAPATDPDALRERIAAAIWERQNPGRRYADCEYRWQADAEADADAVLAVLPAPTDQTAVTCSAQHHRFDDGRLCIRAAQHSGDHIDERGYHWSDTVAVYPLADGQFRTGANVRDALRRMAGEAQQDDYEATTGHAITCAAGFGMGCQCDGGEAQQDPTQDGEADHRQADLRAAVMRALAQLRECNPLTARRLLEAAITAADAQPTAVARPGQPETDRQPADTAQQPKEA